MMARRRFVEYPRVVYGPYGATRTISRVEDWPAGWTATPEKDDDVAPSVPIKHPYTRAELKTLLRTERISFPETAADSELYRLLTA